MIVMKEGISEAALEPLKEHLLQDLELMVLLIGFVSLRVLSANLG